MENLEHRCSKCANWQHGVCVITKERTWDIVCNCGQFKLRKTKDD